MTMVIRPATAADLDGVRDVEREVFGDDPYPRFFFRQALDLWGDLLRVAAPAPGRVAGYALGALARRPGEGWILSAAVRPAHRGGGVATRLTGDLLEALRAAGARQARLTVHPGNAAALGLYRRLGFQEVAEEADYYGPGDPRVVMRLALPPRA